jgi:hypothetical protein
VTLAVGHRPVEQAVRPRTVVGFLVKKSAFTYIFKAVIKSLRATLPDEILYWEFCFLNSAFH